jgi:hypothetical protein
MLAGKEPPGNPPLTGDRGSEESTPAGAEDGCVLLGYLLSWNQQSAEPLLIREQHFWQDKAGKTTKLKGSRDGLLRIITGAWM